MTCYDYVACLFGLARKTILCKIHIELSANTWKVVTYEVIKVKEMKERDF